MTDEQIVNAHQAEAWNGYEGKHWADHQSRYDDLNDPANAPLLDAAHIESTDKVLDIGCGNGRLTRLAAHRAAHALGVDLCCGARTARTRPRSSSGGGRCVTGCATPGRRRWHGRGERRPRHSGRIGTPAGGVRLTARLWLVTATWPGER